MTRRQQTERDFSLFVEDERRFAGSFKNYRPYPKQKRFHDLGKSARERLLMAGNQLGKTRAASFEVAMHLTGLYPDWWQGRRFDHPIHAWASSLTGEATRDNPQRALLGRAFSVVDLSRGALPPGFMLSSSRSGGSVPGALDSLRVRHRCGGVSILQFKSYAQGREKWQGPKLDLVWFDEEPPLDIYIEGLTRTNASNGLVMLTFTPLLGYSSVVQRFWDPKGKVTASVDRKVVQMTLEEVGHLDDKARARIIASYPDHERDARTKGIPVMGSGRIFTTDEALIRVKPFDIPSHWLAIGGIDFGWDHPTAAVKLVWDRDKDHVYLTHAYRKSRERPSVHVKTIAGWGRALPISWPHDGLQHEKGSGQSLAEVYAQSGLNMLPEHARMPLGGNSVEASLMDWLERIAAGKFSVFDTLDDWFEEYRTFHRKDGRIVALRDDLISATRYALMSLRFGRLNSDLDGVRETVGQTIADDYDPLDWGLQPVSRT